MCHSVGAPARYYTHMCTYGTRADTTFYKLSSCMRVNVCGCTRVYACVCVRTCMLAYVHVHMQHASVGGREGGLGGGATMCGSKFTVATCSGEPKRPPPRLTSTPT